jgi:hypothetical protein
MKAATRATNAIELHALSSVTCFDGDTYLDIFTLDMQSIIPMDKSINQQTPVCSRGADILTHDAAL